MKRMIVLSFGIALFNFASFGTRALAQDAICVDCVVKAAESSNLPSDQIEPLRKTVEEINKRLAGQPLSPIIGGFVRNADGSVKTNMSHDQASKECEQIGSRLPTIREFAKEAETKGALLVEVSDFYAGKIPGGLSKHYFLRNHSYEGKGKTDDFFYSFQNSSGTQGELSQYQTWASSLFPKYEHDSGDYAVR